jgi:hypothetical protein
MTIASQTFVSPCTPQQAVSTNVKSVKYNAKNARGRAPSRVPSRPRDASASVPAGEQSQSPTCLSVRPRASPIQDQSVPGLRNRRGFWRSRANHGRPAVGRTDAQLGHPAAEGRPRLMSWEACRQSGRVPVPPGPFQRMQISLLRPPHPVAGELGWLAPFTRTTPACEAEVWHTVASSTMLCASSHETSRHCYRDL